MTEHLQSSSYTCSEIQKTQFIDFKNEICNTFMWFETASTFLSAINIYTEINIQGRKEGSLGVVLVITG